MIDSMSHMKFAGVNGALKEYFPDFGFMIYIRLSIYELNYHSKCILMLYPTIAEIEILKMNTLSINGVNIHSQLCELFINDHIVTPELEGLIYYVAAVEPQILHNLLPEFSNLESEQLAIHSIAYAKLFQLRGE